MTPWEKFERMVSLKSEKVELATFADPDTQLKRAEENYNSVLSFADKIYAIKESAKKTVPKNLELLDRSRRELENDLNDFLSKAKELGIDPSKLQQPKDYEKAIKRIETLFERANNMYKEMK